ncbi:MAG: AEC family transporter [Clostridia bacterium]|nr:AEC family transporter [Clostridia bacterium]
MAFLILLGFILRKTRVIDERIQKGLSEILLKAVLPFSILMSSNIEYSYDFVKAMIAVAAAAACYYFFGIVVLNYFTGRFKLDSNERIVIIMVSIFANTSFVGFPVMSALFGESGLLLASVYNLVFNVFFYTYGLAAFSHRKMSVRSMSVSMITLASIAAIAIFISPFRLPSFATDTLLSVANMATPMSMMIVGSSLATVDSHKLFSDKKSFVAALLRTVVFPFIMLLAVLLVRLRFYMMPVTATAIVLMTSLPSGLMSVVISEQTDCAPKFCVRTVFLSFIFMIITLPLMMFICGKLFV